MNSDYITTYEKWRDNKTNDNAEAVNNVIKWIDYNNKQKNNNNNNNNDIKKKDIVSNENH